MNQRAWHPRAFFRSLSDDVAQALALELGVLLPPEEEHAAEGLARAWLFLEDGRRRRIEAALCPLSELCGALGREFLHKLAVERWQETRPDWVASVVAFSTEDLAVRLYLEDARAFTEAHALFIRKTSGDSAFYRGKYVADVVPSFDRRSRMKQLICDHFLETRPELVLEGTVFGELVEDDKFVLFVCKKQHAEELMGDSMGRSRTLADFQDATYLIALAFEYETSVLAVKAPGVRDRECLRRAFARVFTGDPSYFEDLPDASESRTEILDLNALDESDQITHVQVDRVTVRKADRESTRLTFEFESGLALDRAVLALRSHGVRLMNDNVEGAGLVVHFAGAGRMRKRSILLERLGRDPRARTRREQMIHRYLRAWNLDADRRNPLIAAALPTPETRDHW